MPGGGQSNVGPGSSVEESWAQSGNDGARLLWLWNQIGRRLVRRLLKQRLVSVWVQVVEGEQ